MMRKNHEQMSFFDEEEEKRKSEAEEKRKKWLEDVKNLDKQKHENIDEEVGDIEQGTDKGWYNEWEEKKGK